MACPHFGGNHFAGGSVNLNGKITFTGSGPHVVGPSSVGLELRGNLASAAGGADVIIGSTQTRAGASDKLVSFQNNTGEEAYIDRAGKIYVDSAIGLSFLSDTNTGMNNPNPDHITMVAGNTNIIGARLEAATQKIGFFSTVAAAPVAQQTVTGSKGANAALTSLLTALAAFGLIVDSTT